MYGESFVREAIMGGAIRTVANERIVKAAEQAFEAECERVRAENERVAALHLREVEDKLAREEAYRMVRVWQYRFWLLAVRALYCYAGSAVLCVAACAELLLHVPLGLGLVTKDVISSLSDLRLLMRQCMHLIYNVTHVYLHLSYSCQPWSCTHVHRCHHPFQVLHVLLSSATF